MFYLKLLLLVSMAVLMIVTLNVTTEISNDAVSAALFALMAATSLLVSQLPTQGQAGILLNFIIQFAAAIAAFASAVHWIASESDSIEHIMIPIVTAVTGFIGLIVIFVLLIYNVPSLMKLSSSAQDRNEKNGILAFYRLAMLPLRILTTWLGTLFGRFTRPR